MKDILCVYCTRTSLTKGIMEKIAKELDAELVEFTDGKNRSGALGYIKACFESMSKKYPEILDIKTERPLQEYSSVVVGMPIWVEGPCILGKAFLEKYSNELPQNVHFVVTHMSKVDYEKPINKLDIFLKAPHKSHLSVCSKQEDLSKEIKDFVSEIKQ